MGVHRIAAALFVFAAPTWAAGISEGHIVAIHPPGGSLPPNAVIFGVAGGTYFSTGLEITIQIDGSDLAVVPDPATCIAGAFGGYNCVVPLHLPPLPAGEDVVIAIPTPLEPTPPTATFSISDDPDTSPPELAGTVTGVARFLPGGTTGSSCNKEVFDHFNVELDVPSATDDVGVLGYEVSVGVADGPAVKYLAIPDVSEEGARIHFDLVHVDEITECYYVRAIDVAGNVSEPLEPFCIALSTAQPEPGPGAYCDELREYDETSLGCASTGGALPVAFAAFLLVPRKRAGA